MSVMKMQSRERWLLPLSGMLLVMGGLLGLQYHTWRANDPALWQRGEAGQVLRSYRSEMDKQKTEIGDLRAKLTTYENKASGGGFSEVLNSELQKAKVGLGTVPVQGPGIVLELSDPVRRANKDLGEVFVLHDWDLIQVINQLWATGAEAISLNGQRIIAGTAVVCSGPLVQVNHETIPSPFIFTVIGDQKTLTSGLEHPPRRPR